MSIPIPPKQAVSTSPARQYSSATGHQLPRRASASKSVTLRHHRLARDASLRASPGSGPTDSTNPTSSPRRNSSGDSHQTGQSDPKKWFDQSNQNPTATYDDNNVMDVDPPFFQKESDSSNGDESSYPYQTCAVPPRLVTAQSSSVDDYRSVIDDLTVEIQKLKEELKRYKQNGPDMLSKEKLFEIKIHGLPKRKRRELETTLRDFTASLWDSTDTSSQRKKPRHATRDNMYSTSGSMSKHASSSSGSNARPVDSAYASMSTGTTSCRPPLERPPMHARARSSEQKVQSYLRDIPAGLYPRHVALSARDKKKLVVRRLEQLFTGKAGGRPPRRGVFAPTSGNLGPGNLGPAVVEEQSSPARRPQPQQLQPLPSLHVTEPCREARILPLERPSDSSAKKLKSRDNVSASNSNGDGTEAIGNGNSSGSGLNPSPPNMPPPPEQRPTRVKDLDPDRVQDPSENMEYIRHLGLVPPELLTDASQAAASDVQPDAEGWVYLNLLCNLAQLHIINVTPGFVRLAVSELSTKFQLSPDGRKIRWRGGTKGTKFSSDSSGDVSQRSPETESSSGSKEESCKRQKTGKSTGDDGQSGDSSDKNPYRFGPQVSMSSESFHYKPLFVQQESPNVQTSIDETLSTYGPVDDSNQGASGWELSGSGTSNRRKRRHDGAIIYYNGAPFCTDLSGDAGDMSPATYMLSSEQEPKLSEQEVKEVPAQFVRPQLRRSASGSSLNYRPLSDGPISGASPMEEVEVEAAELKSPRKPSSSNGDSACDVHLDLNWSQGQQYMETRPLEPCGLGGVLPDDHFMVVVSTKRPGADAVLPDGATRPENTDCIVNRLATMSTSSPGPTASAPTKCPTNPVEVRYVSGRIKRLVPVPLPPPAIFLPPFSTDESSNRSTDGSIGGMDDDDDDESSECTSRKANPHQSDGYSDGVELSSGDEDGEEPDDEPDTHRMYDVDTDPRPGAAGDDDTRRSMSSAEAAPGTLRARSKSTGSEMLVRTGGSSVATAGGVGSGYRSSVEASN